MSVSGGLHRRRWIPRTAGIALLTAGLVAAAGARALPAAAPAPGMAAAPEPQKKPSANVQPTLAPQAIPVEYVFREADALDAPLGRARAAAEADPAVEEVERRLDAATAPLRELSESVEPQRLGDASTREIERLRQELARAELQLAAAQATLEKRSALVSEASRELQLQVASWQLTAEAARRERAPPAVTKRIAEAQELLRVEEARLRERLDRALALQGRVSELRSGVKRAAAAVDEADETLNEQLFEAESAPLWRALGTPERAGNLGAQLRQALRESARDVASFVREEQGRLWLHLCLVVALALGLSALRRPLAAMGKESGALRGAARVLDRPGSAALLVSMPAAGWLYPPLAPAVKDLVSLALVWPLLRVLPAILPETFRRPLLGLAALFALDRLSAMAPPRTLLARLSVLLVTAGGLAALVRGLRRGGWARLARGGGWGAATRAAAAVALGLLGVSAISNVVGNASLAERLTRATLAAAARAVGLLAVVVVLEGVLAALLSVPALARRALVARHRALLERRIAAILRAAGLAWWAVATARDLGILEDTVAAAGSVLALRLKVGGLDVSLGNVAAFAVTLALAVGLSRVVRFVLEEGVFAELDMPRGIPTAISTTIQYVLVVLGFSWAVLASGMEMSRFSFLVGALGVGVGFGLQNVVNNLVSGLILLYERPVQVRDVIEVGAVVGEVTRIGIRSSTVRTFAGAEVIVPNATLISAEVTNWTLSDRRRRIELSVGVAYGTPPRKVVDLLLGVVRDRPGVLADPAPVALFLRFGESTLDFVLRFWTANFDQWPALASEVMISLCEGLEREGIRVPFPQRDLHVRTIDAARAVAIGAPTPDAERTPPLGKTGAGPGG
jgi:small-conductance mechanosensitive channel